MSRETLKQKQEKQEAIDHLREVLKPGDKVYGVVRSVSRSGMSRLIDFYTFGEREEHGRPAGCGELYLSGWIATALGYSRSRDGALKVGGCGMDMIFSVVYNLGRVLFPDGFGVECEHCGLRAWTQNYLKQMRLAGCPKNDKVAPDPRLHPIHAHATHTFRGRNGDRSGWDSDGGYALRYGAL